MIKERKLNRLQGYDYSSDNLYFVTSCVQNRVCCFGEIGVERTGRDPSVNNIDIDTVGPGRDLALPQNGEIVSEIASVWTGRDLSIHSGDLSPSLSGSQMILNIYGEIAEKQWYWLSEQYQYVVLHAFVVMPNHIHGIIEINRAHVRTGRDLSLQPKIKSLSELMGAYKTTVSKQIHLTGFMEFLWQRSFHEHIIRDEKAFETISDYIINNPINWQQDKFYNL